MTATYEPGSVAMIRQVNAESERRALRIGNIGWHLRPTTPGEEQAGNDFVRDGEVASVRPLVVLDLDGVDVGLLRSALARWTSWSSLKSEQRIIGLIIDEVDAQTKPPRIPEPGLWGVVAAQYGPVAGRPWTFARAACGWVCLDDGSCREWDDLIDPTLIREGLS